VLMEHCSFLGEANSSISRPIKGGNTFTKRLLAGRGGEETGWERHSVLTSTNQNKRQLLPRKKRKVKKLSEG